MQSWILGVSLRGGPEVMSLEVVTPAVLDRPESLHREMPWILLAASAELPRPNATLPAAERDRLLTDLLECERCLAEAEGLIRRRERPESADIDPREVRGAWRKFF